MQAHRPVLPPFMRQQEPRKRFPIIFPIVCSGTVVMVGVLVIYFTSPDKPGQFFFSISIVSPRSSLQRSNVHTCTSHFRHDSMISILILIRSPSMISIMTITLISFFSIQLHTLWRSNSVEAMAHSTILFCVFSSRDHDPCHSL